MLKFSNLGFAFISNAAIIYLMMLDQTPIRWRGYTSELICVLTKKMDLKVA